MFARDGGRSSPAFRSFRILNNASAFQIRRRKRRSVPASWDWAQAQQEVHAEILAWYKRTLGVRRAKISPLLERMGGHAGSYQALGTGAVTVRWRTGEDTDLVLAANLSDNSTDGFPLCAGEVLWQEGAAPVDTLFRPWSVRWTREQADPA